MSQTEYHLDDVERGRGEGQETAPPGGTAAQLQHGLEHGCPENGINDSIQTPKPSDNPAQDFDEDANDLWSLYGKEAKSHDEEWIKDLKDDMDAILIFAGLFAGVLTAFVILKIPDLKVNSADQSAYYQKQTAYMLGQISQQLASGDRQISSDYTPYPTFQPSASDRRVNILWLISLVCSLSAALLATLVQQWSRAYMRIFQQSRNPLKSARIRLFLFEGARHLPSVADFVPGLSISLSYFFSGDFVTSFFTSTNPSLSPPWFLSLFAYPSIFSAWLYQYGIPNRPFGPHFHPTFGVSSKDCVATSIIPSISDWSILCKTFNFQTWKHIGNSLRWN
ncbi:hypothetical protein BGY98DRAFT_736242 [Russula aff. rugulosa BPL654]|nr:hypothetical protein BGY98DRAFT_736242 [Russula aff. rugulosa BPL654]